MEARVSWVEPDTYWNLDFRVFAVKNINGYELIDKDPKFP